MDIQTITFIILLSLCTSDIFQCVASVVNSRPPRSLDDLTKIARGHDVRIEDYPFIVSIQKTFGHSCGGTMVHPLWVLTAAHCVSGPPPAKVTYKGHVDPLLDASVITVVAGWTSVSKVGYREDPAGPDNPHRRRVIKIHRHEQYESVTDMPKYWNDIALMTLESSFGKELSVQLTTLATRDFVEPAKCVAIGWGFQPTSPAKRSSNPAKREPNPHREKHPEYYYNLKAVSILIVDKSYCTSPPYNQRFLEETQLCLDTRTTGNPCKGDSGGPLVFDGIQVGITSFIAEANKELCSRNPMAVYTRVAKFRDWIAKFVPETGTGAARTCQLSHAVISIIMIMYLLS